MGTMIEAVLEISIFSSGREFMISVTLLRVISGNDLKVFLFLILRNAWFHPFVFIYKIIQARQIN